MPGKEPIQIKSGVIFQLKKDPITPVSDSNSIPNLDIQTPTCLFGCLLESTQMEEGGVRPKLSDLNSSKTLQTKASKLLTQFDSLTDDAFAGFVATKTALDQNLDTALADIKSQEIAIRPPVSDKDSTYAVGVTSLVSRLPAFDHITHQDRAYMRIKSDQIVRAKPTKQIPEGHANKNEQVLIIPTDDSRLRIVLIPGVFVERSNMLQSVQEVLTTMQAVEEEESKPVSA